MQVCMRGLQATLSDACRDPNPCHSIMSIDLDLDHAHYCILMSTVIPCMGGLVGDAILACEGVSLGWRGATRRLDFGLCA